MASWVPVASDSDFSLSNLPYGVFSTKTEGPHIGVAIGESVLDLKMLASYHVFDDLEFDTTALEQETLNMYAGLGKEVHGRLRRRLKVLLAKDTQLANTLRDDQDHRQKCLFPLQSVTMHLPVGVGDYTDFFIGLYHAQNSADFLQAGASITELIPSFWDTPPAYHGRSSSVIVSGTPVRRPKGQTRVNGKPTSGYCQKVEFEVEFAAVIGQGNRMGEAIDIDRAEDHIFGFVLLNDWSARDFQANEMTAFTSKNWATQISPWVVPSEALEPFRTTPTSSDRPFLDYSTQKETKLAYDISIRATLEVVSQKYQMSSCNTKHVVYSFVQMLAHHTRGGCPLRPGDLLATGTLSGPTRPEQGCFLELSRVGKEAYEMTAVGSPSEKISRTFLEDEDIVEIVCQIRPSDGSGNVGFGACYGKVLPGN